MISNFNIRIFIWSRRLLSLCDSHSWFHGLDFLFSLIYTLFYYIFLFVSLLQWSIFQRILNARIALVLHSGTPLSTANPISSKSSFAFLRFTFSLFNERQHVRLLRLKYADSVWGYISESLASSFMCNFTSQFRNLLVLEHALRELPSVRDLLTDWHSVFSILISDFVFSFFRKLFSWHLSPAWVSFENKKSSNLKNPLNYDHKNVNFSRK